MASRMTKIELYNAVTQIKGLDLQQREMPQPLDGAKRYYFRAEGFTRTCLGLSEAAEYITGVLDGLQLAKEQRDAEMDTNYEDWDKADDRHGEEVERQIDYDYAEHEDIRLEDPDPDSGENLGLESRGVSASSSN